MEHSFDIDLAKEYGIAEAILLNNFSFWIAKNRANGQNFYDGYYWTYNSTKAFAELFPYLSQRQIQNALKHLREEGILQTGNYNKLAYDRTLWYAFTKKGECIMQKCKMDDANMSKANDNDAQAIPNINSDKNTNKKTDNNILPDSDDEIQEKLKRVLENQGTVSAPPFKAEVAEVVAYLNEKAGTRYRPSSKSNSQHIHARLAEGFTVDDCKAVIDKKCAEWLGTDFAQYLRPVTLFGGKFEAYLNAPAKTRKTYGKTGIEVTVPENDDLKGIL